ncbi:MAG: hypothetical protein M3O94_03830 [Actinomycetota bacterium]|nr:hypothetical protein [Actinomycetota bacterium]
MRTPHRPLRLTARSAGIGMAGLLVAGLAAIAGPTLASAQAGGGMSMSGMHMSTGVSPNAIGNTDGWLHGETYNFHYEQNFFCKEPPTSAVISHCELGAAYDAIPSSEFDPLYVVVPIGFTPKNPNTLQCPQAGNCVDHPNRIDLSRVFGSGTAHALLPPHSHIVTTEAGGAPEWWNVDVIGVKTQQAWHRIVLGKSYSVIQGMRVAGNPGVTDNIPTNLFLFFAVQEKG